MLTHTNKQTMMNMTRSRNANKWILLNIETVGISWLDSLCVLFIADAERVADTPEVVRFELGELYVLAVRNSVSGKLLILANLQ